MFRKTLAILAVLAFLPSCFDEPVKPVTEAPPSDFPAMTSEDDIVQALVWCYENPGSEKTMSRYEGILHSEYFFYLDAGDVEPGGSPVITRSEDIASTEWIFDNNTLLELTIAAAGDWYPRAEIDGSSCDGCLETSRAYFIRAQFERDGTIFQSRPSGPFVTIVIAPDESDPSKWVVRAIYDISPR